MDHYNKIIDRIIAALVLAAVIGGILGIFVVAMSGCTATQKAADIVFGPIATSPTTQPTSPPLKPGIDEAAKAIDLLMGTTLVGTGWGLLSTIWGVWHRRQQQTVRSALANVVYGVNDVIKAAPAEARARIESKQGPEATALVKSLKREKAIA